MGLICGTAMLPLTFYGFPWFVPGLVVLAGVILDLIASSAEPGA